MAAATTALDRARSRLDELLLLGLIAKHKLDVTEVALGVVTDEFIAHIKAAGDDRKPWERKDGTPKVRKGFGRKPPGNG